jgi:hypothetical protein
MPTLLKDWYRGCGRSMIVRLASVLIVVPLACALIFVPLWLVTSRGMSIWWLIGASLVFLAILFGGGAAGAGWVFYRRRREWDALFTPLGLTGKLYQMFFRQYHGTVEGRQVDVYFYRGPTLVMQVSTSLQTRLGVTGPQSDTLALARLFGRQPLVLDELEQQGLCAFAIDENWAGSLFANPHVLGLLQRLTALESFFTRQQVILRPGAVELLFTGNRNLFAFDVAPEQARQWLEDVLRLARIAEHLDAPLVTEEESAAERLARSLRSRNPYVMPIVTASAVLGVFVCAVATAIALGLMNNSL